MILDIITQEDLEAFKKELFKELRELAITPGNQPPKLLKSYQVCDLLGISYGTLRNMRRNGTLSYTKIGGLISYDYDQIMNLIEKIKKH